MEKDAHIKNLVTRYLNEYDDEYDDSYDEFTRMEVGDEGESLDTKKPAGAPSLKMDEEPSSESSSGEEDTQPTSSSSTQQTTSDNRNATESGRGRGRGGKGAGYPFWFCFKSVDSLICLDITNLSRTTEKKERTKSAALGQCKEIKFSPTRFNSLLLWGRGGNERIIRGKGVNGSTRL